MGTAATIQHVLDRRGRSVAEPKLTGVRSRFVADRRRFAPNQLGAAAAEPDVATESQLVGSAVERAVATLHRLDGEAVAAAHGADCDRLKKDLISLGKRQGVTEACSFARQSVGGFLTK